MKTNNERQCKLMKLLYDYGKAKNYTMKEIHQESSDYVSLSETRISHWNASKIFFQYLEKEFDLYLEDAIQQDVDLNNISFSNNDWPYAIGLASNINKLYFYARFFDWSTSKIGTFFVKALSILYKKSKGYNRNKSFLSLGIKALHHLFTIPEQEMSLIDISYLYSLMDLKAIEDLTRTKRSVPPPPTPLTPPQQPKRR